MFDENGDEVNKPATDVFEIEDFTAATEWENFMDELENIVRGWKLVGARHRRSKGAASTSSGWKQKQVEMSYLNFPFLVTHYKEDDKLEFESDVVEDDNTSSCVLDDLTRGKYDFSSSGPIPSTFFALSEMIVISPAGKEILGNETRAGQVVGAVNIALHNTDCRLPVLVQVMEPRKQLYIGTAISNNCRTEFSSVQLNKRPAHVTHLAGLLQLFKNRISSPLPVEISPTTVSVRFSHQLEDWTSYSWSVDPPDLDLFTLSGDTDFIQLKEIQFGCVSDPVAGLVLHTTWRDLSEELIVDNSVHSDLDPLEAPEWSISIMLQEKPECLLGRHIGAVLQLCSDSRNMKQLLGDILDGETDDEGGHVSGLLDKIASGGGPQMSPYSLTNIARQVRPLRNRSPTGGPLKPALLKYVLSYLFPDSADPCLHPYFLVDRNTAVNSQTADQLYCGGSVKTSPWDGLAWRLSTTVACCVGWAGAAGVAHLLHEFCLEVRYRWENGISLPGVKDGPPDTGSTLLHQKLQMINCCIARRIVATSSSSAAVSASLQNPPVTIPTDADMDSDDTDYDEFFECENDDNAKDNQAPPVNTHRPAWETSEGRTERIGQLRLLNDDDWIYRPMLQEPAPLTEDQLAEQAEVLMQLGSDQAGSEVRAKLQSVNLLSDMESFKAANPGCVLGDFVRWHSPRDWQEGVGLSPRMKLPGNMWTELWEQARAVPAHRQKRLFDETREAEKVLQFLTNLTPGELAQLTMPTLLQAGHYRILSCPESTVCSELNNEIASLLASLSKLLCLPEVKHYRGNVRLEEFAARESKCWKVLELLTTSEVAISRLLSLNRKFMYDLTVAGGQEDLDTVKEMERFVKSLCGASEVVVPGAARGPAGRLIQSMFRESQQVQHPRVCGLPPPSTKQFTLRCVSARPLPSSRPTPQRLYACMAAGEFRLAGAYTIDRQYL